MNRTVFVLPRWLTSALLTAALVPGVAGSEPTDRLARGFAAPPATAKPWVYWFWSDGNLTREGITADLEAMARMGIGGVLIMEVDQGIPAGPARFMTVEWRELFQHVLAEADRLELEVNMNNDGGWCGSGGPWVKPEHAMQMVVWSETRLEGPCHFEGTLPQPKTIADFYRDIATLAVPSPAVDDPAMPACRARLTRGDTGEDIDAAALVDGDATTVILLPNPQPGKPHVLQLEFLQPIAVQAVSLTIDTRNLGCEAELSVSAHGGEFKAIRAFQPRWPLASANFPEVSARFFRLAFKSIHPPGANGLAVADVALHAHYRLEDVAGRAGYVRQDTFAGVVDVSVLADTTVPSERVMDLTARVDQAGRLSWDVPNGKWTVLRFGHTPTGAKNAPAPAESVGLECDKLSKPAIESHFAGFIGKLVADQKAAGTRALKMTHIDSWEVGSQNWTSCMRDEFRSRRGYDLLPFLPVLTGRVVETPEVSDRFLWDWRRCIADLLADNYAGHMREICRRNGLKLSVEAYGDGVFDQLSYAGRVDVPMAEFWVGGGALGIGKAMASAAHTYGHAVVGAESFTASPEFGKWMNHPGSLKTLGDAAFCQGINRFIFHRYAMQPWRDRRPGMTMGPWGVHYERTQTWWEQTRPWHEYLARCQYLLRQGLFVADLCYLQTEDAPNGLFHAPPSSYEFDGCTAEVVFDRMTVEDGRLVLPDGMSYRLLVLPPRETMTPKLLRRISELVQAGATVVGPRPIKSPSLADYPTCDDEVKRLADELWADCNGRQVTERRYGKGRVICGKAPDAVLAEMGVRPDFRCETPAGRGGLRYLHRAVDGIDVYFVANISRYPLDMVCSFRVLGKRPEFWWPETGRTEQVVVYDEVDGGIRMPIWLDRGGSLFVVFRPGSRPASERIVSLVRGDEPVLAATGYAAQIVIQKAMYGVPDDPDRTRDVTVQLQELADRGEYTFPVSSLAEAGDPAQGVVKTLRVEYTMDGNRRTASGTDSETIHLSAQAHAIVVNKAVYGVLDDPNRTRDVTTKLQRLIDRGEYAFQVASMAHGDDPAFGIVKTLRVDYTVDGESREAGGTDPETLLLVGSPPRDAHLLRGADGQLCIEARKPGRYVAKRGSGRTEQVDILDLPQPLAIESPWELRFPARHGAADRVILEKLVSWSEHANPDVKYFSGLATYSNTFHLPEEWVRANRRVYLDLGRVEVIAQVQLNGHDLGILWNPPFELDITDAVTAGNNALEIKVVNLWVNRLIGDQQLAEDCQWQGQQMRQWPQWLLEGKPSPTGRLSFTTWKHYTKESPLVESGLLGPVRMRPAAVVQLKP